jgi:hypothetical protein
MISTTPRNPIIEMCLRYAAEMSEELDSLIASIG